MASAVPAPTARPGAEEDPLDLAAQCIERGDSASAVVQLQKHLLRYPDQMMIRAYLAELLFKLQRLPEARDQYERFVAAAQEVEGAPRDHVVHCHTRLMEIAQQQRDPYGEHLHRGIGMVLLVRKVDSNGVAVEAGDGFRERLLCKAASELVKAAHCRPDEPRPPWYLVEVWTKMAQPRSAAVALREARQKAALLNLPPAEQRALVLASTPEARRNP